jgi:hypothetical protein
LRRQTLDIESVTSANPGKVRRGSWRHAFDYEVGVGNSAKPPDWLPKAHSVGKAAAKNE